MVQPSASQGANRIWDKNARILSGSQCSGGPIDIHHHIHIDIVDPPRLA